MRTQPNPPATPSPVIDDATLTLERNGDIPVTAQDLSCKCGPLGANVISYRVKATCRDKLDGSGFLIDHNDIHAWMMDTFAVRDVFPSCERIADMACRGIWNLLIDHGAEPVKLKVHVAAFGMAGVTAKFRTKSGKRGAHPFRPDTAPDTAMTMAPGIWDGE